MPGDRDSGLHLTDSDFADYADGRVAAAERATLELHLADCRDCRDALVEVWRLAGSAHDAARRRHRVLQRASLLAVAAAAALVLVVGRPGVDSAVPTHRAAEAATAPRPDAPQGPVAARPVFSWTGAPGADLYRVVLFDADGLVLWEGETRVTRLDLPAAVPLVAGRSYFWKVEARRDWNRWISSELTGFTIEPGVR